MHNLYYFNKLIYKGNINRDFYFHTCKSNKKLYLYIFVHLFFSVSSLFSAKMKIKKVTYYHKYLNKVSNLDFLLKTFKEKKQSKINKWYQNKKDAQDYIIALCPKFLASLFVSSKNLIAYELTSNNEIKLSDFDKEINNITTEFKEAYYPNLFAISKYKSTNKYLCIHNLFLYFPSPKFLKKLKIITKILIFLFCAFILLLISFTFTTVYLDYNVINTYLKDIPLLILNILPIIIVLLFFLILTKRLWLSFGLTSTLIFIIGIVNKTKLYYRDDVFKFEDITLIKEAAVMTQRYAIIIRWYTVICILACLIFTLILRNYIKKYHITLKKQLLSLLIISLLSVFLVNKIYTNAKIYENVGDTSNINIWIATRQSQVRGLIYPFIYSITELQDKPANYNAKEAENILNKYQSDNIPEEKKVNIIAIMLEAYNDFSQFKSIKFIDDIYAPLHRIEKNSLSGKLVVNIFGGGTIDTERKFLTGYYTYPNMRQKTNSYVWYFKDQGYKTAAMHPIYGSFYNRNTVNANLGFDYYWAYENKFSSIKEDWLTDEEFFSYILNDLKENNEKGNKYFNFSVTYQNHGPYSTEYFGNDFIKNQGYSSKAYNNFNNYLENIKNTNQSLEKLVTTLDNYKEPTILIFFGDHNPYLGEANYTYEELGIDMSLNSLDSFLNYYTTPYVIHANEAAKKVFNKSFVGSSATISPNFLMNELFNYLELEGNEYLKYTNDIKKKIDVLNDIYIKENGSFIMKDKSKYLDLIEEFNNVSYYYSHK